LDYYLFPNLKKHLKGRKCSSIEATFAAQPKEFFLDGLKKLEQRSHKCLELRGEYQTFWIHLYTRQPSGLMSWGSQSSMFTQWDVHLKALASASTTK
jgi:hypothetical protein